MGDWAEDRCTPRAYVSRPGFRQLRGPVCEKMIRKTTKGYVLLSKTTGKKLGGPYKTREQALKRERQVQFFKRRKAA